MKHYTEADLRARISKKYHYMINWRSTFSGGFDGWVVLVENDETHARGQQRYLIHEPVSHLNYYLREIEKNPEFDW